MPGAPTSIAPVAELACRAAANAAAMHRHPIVVSGERAERLLGWRPRDDTAGALRRFAQTLD